MKVSKNIINKILPFQGKILHTDILINQEDIIIRKERRLYGLDIRFVYFIRFTGYNNNTDKLINNIFILLNLYKSKWTYHILENRIYIFQSTVCIEISTFNINYVKYRLEKTISKRNSC